jgi:hypothetical protein
VQSIPEGREDERKGLHWENRKTVYGVVPSAFLHLPLSEYDLKELMRSVYICTIYIYI